MWLIDNAPSQNFNDFAWKVCDSISGNCYIYTFIDINGTYGTSTTGNDVLNILNTHSTPTGSFPPGTPSSSIRETFTVPSGGELEIYKDQTFWATGGNVGDDCTGQQVTTGYQCIEVEGLGGYMTKALCESDPDGNCGTKETSWDCTSKGCHEISNSSGPYSSWCDCMDNSPCCADGSGVLGIDGTESLGVLDYVYYNDNCLSNKGYAIWGCMDDGITTDPDITNDRPSGWVGQATNYNPNATQHLCGCQYSQQAATLNCSGKDGVVDPADPFSLIAPYTCYDPLDGTGVFTSTTAQNNNFANAMHQCQDSCGTSAPCPPNPHTFIYDTADATTNATTYCAPSNADGKLEITFTSAIGTLDVRILDSNGIEIYTHPMDVWSGDTVELENIVSGEYTLNVNKLS